MGDAPARLMSRSQLLRRGSAGAGLLIGGVSVAGLVGAAASAGDPGGDARILNFALRLEFLQEAYYAAASVSPALDEEVLGFARAAAAHEREHIAVLRDILGDSAEDPPEFDFGETTANQSEFLRVAVILEDLGVDAYNGQAANLSRDALIAVARIVSVDARHAAWIRSLEGRVPAPAAVDVGRSAAEVDAEIDRTGFVAAGG